jgi:ATP-dependent DNA helicase RecG
MLKHDMLEIIANGENSVVEFKRDEIRPEQLAKEIVAFANSYGGRLFVGVDDDGEVSGIQRADLEHWIMDTVCGRYVHPALIPKYEEVQLDASIRVAVITVPMGSSKPYVVCHNDREDFYIRVGSISKLATREQIVRMSASGGMLHVETMPVPRTSMKSLDKARLENYFRDILAEPSLPSNDEEWTERLEDMGFLTNSSDQGKVCTIAGLVLFGINPRRYLKQAGLRLMVFDSLDKEYKALLDTVLDGPMVARVELAEQRVSGIVDDGLVEKAASALQPFITEESDVIDKGFRRPLNRLYPWNAIRELILNALAHRDWTRSTDIEICRYNDRLEVISPGALPNSMTVEKMVGGRRTPRNTIIMEVLRDYQYVDARGMGIRTKVIPIMREFNDTEPTFEATEDYLKTSLFSNGPKNEPDEAKYDPKTHANDPTTNTHDPITDPKTDILTLITENPSITYAELANSINKSPATVKRYLQELKASGRVTRSGGRKGGRWLVK